MFGKGPSIVHLLTVIVIVSVGVRAQDPDDYFGQDEIYDEYYEEGDDYDYYDSYEDKKDDNIKLNGDNDNDTQFIDKIVDNTNPKDRKIIMNEIMMGVQNGMGDMVGILKDIARSLDCEKDADVCSWPFTMVRTGECLYMNLDYRKTWSAAREYCQSLGADLAEPLSNNQDLNYIMTLSGTARIHIGHDRLWVGASDMNKEGVWHWVSGKQVSRDIGWTINQPRDITGQEDCMAMIFTHPPTVKALSCFTRKPFICQKYF